MKSKSWSSSYWPEKTKPKPLKTKNWDGKPKEGHQPLPLPKNENVDLSHVVRYVKSKFDLLEQRCENGRWKASDEFRKGYHGIELRMTREEFKTWCLAHQEEICEKGWPNLRRKDIAGHYSLNNIYLGRANPK